MSGEAETLTVSLEAWEGPLDLLLAMARTQKVDLRDISILALVEQYLAWLAEAESLRLELAADWLVMAAWLAYLKSALLLPRDPEVEPSPEELAAQLQLRLARLDAMREAGARLMARDRLGRDVFPRGAPEGLRTIRRPRWDASLYDLIAAYGALRARRTPPLHIVARRPVMTLEDAIARVEAMLGVTLDWARLENLMPRGGDAAWRRSALASGFVAMLELARQGRLTFTQETAFGPLMVRPA